MNRESPALRRGECQKNGKVVAKLVTAKVDKKEAFKHFLGLFPEKGLDLDSERVREERLG